MDKLQPYTYYGTVAKIYDGDTLTLDVDLGFDIQHKGQSVRLVGCNAIELNQPGGKEAQQHLATMLPIGTVLMLQSVKFDKYAGRIDADLWLLDHAGNALPGGNVVQLLVAQGWAASWNGKGVKPVPAWPRVTT